MSAASLPSLPAATPTALARGIFGLPDLGKNGTLFPGPRTALSTDNNALYFGIITVVGVTFLVLLILCCFNCCGGEPAGLHSHELEGSITTTAATNTLSRRGSVFEGHASLPRSLAQTRQRTDSLPESRKNNETAAAAAAGPYITANNGRKDFPVVRVHVKRQPDEMNLVVNDRVVLNAVYPDGWASGVSKRSGGPWLFPLVCLGGSVPRVLLQRSQAQQANARPPPMGGGGPGRFEPAMMMAASSSSSSLTSAAGPVPTSAPPPTPPSSFSPQPIGDLRQLPPMNARYGSPPPRQPNPAYLQQQQQQQRLVPAAQMLRSMQPPPPSSQRAYRPQAAGGPGGSVAVAGGPQRAPVQSMYSDISGV
ncbi:hypothetical protein HDU87_004206 [Geranomyces variabilis]|uniref:SH3 domain-containing protein n=1 Tax=Geranomyces variabilis TaxID=109894 RepID=A0AAD5TPA6_9FUNG|nr:hypothetical protein HDU87_004206 [Geranomyces variabilis]